MVVFVDNGIHFPITEPFSVSFLGPFPYVRPIWYGDALATNVAESVFQPMTAVHIEASSSLRIILYIVSCEMNTPS